MDNLLGKKFNRLTPVEKLKNYYYLCKCDCGNYKKVRKDHILKGEIKSCGCLSSETTTLKNLKDAQPIMGHKFGMLKPIAKIGTTKHRESIYKCVCDCGNVINVKGGNLVSGNSTSCGCNKAKLIGEKNSTHGKSNTRLYQIWSAMKRRCFNKNTKDYKNYGGRGIKICESWKNDYTNFEKWALKNGYDESAPYGDCTIDRIDVDGNYEPTNCRWVDLKVQANNKRRQEDELRIR
jgi:hypothetical protein